MKLSEDQVKEIKKRLACEEDVQDALDEMVHDVFSKRASDMNNQGEDAQIEFLAEQFTQFPHLLDYMFAK
jgi:hypothetical protein